MNYTNKMELAVEVPEEELMKWLRHFAPEVSDDADLGAVIPKPDRKVIVIRVRTNKKHTIDYLKSVGRIKA